MDGLHARLGATGLRALIAACLHAIERGQAVTFMNSSLGTIRLPASTDRGRMTRLLLDGVERRSEPVLDVLQTLARTPFESKASEAQREKLETAIEALNGARHADTSGGEDLKRAAAQVVAVLSEVISPEEARRMVHLNAFPDTLDVLLAAVEETGRA
jgi:hypothetical protein